MATEQISILLVDDDEAIRESLGAFFEDEGFAVSYAASGEEALTQITTLQPTLCMTDMGLDGMQGDTFILKAHAVSPTTRYLVYSGLPYTPSAELQALGMTTADVLVKPVTDFTGMLDRIYSLAAPEN